MSETRLFGVWIYEGEGGRSGWIKTGDGMPLHFMNRKLGNMYVIANVPTGFKKNWPNAKVREVGEDGMPIHE